MRNSSKKNILNYWIKIFPILLYIHSVWNEHLRTLEPLRIVSEKKKSIIEPWNLLDTSQRTVSISWSWWSRSRRWRPSVPRRPCTADNMPYTFLFEDHTWPSAWPARSRPWWVPSRSAVRDRPSRWTRWARRLPEESVSWGRARDSFETRWDRCLEPRRISEMPWSRRLSDRSAGSDSCRLAVRYPNCVGKCHRSLHCLRGTRSLNCLWCCASSGSRCTVPQRPWRSAATDIWRTRALPSCHNPWIVAPSTDWRSRIRCHRRTYERWENLAGRRTCRLSYGFYLTRGRWSPCRGCRNRAHNYWRRPPCRRSAVRDETAGDTFPCVPRLGTDVLLIHFVIYLLFISFRYIFFSDSLPITVGSRSRKTALGTYFPPPVSLKKVWKPSSFVQVCGGNIPSGCIPCSKQ